jgi:hypothetical protein
MWPFVFPFSFAFLPGSVRERPCLGECCAVCDGTLLAWLSILRTSFAARRSCSSLHAVHCYISSAQRCYFIACARRVPHNVARGGSSFLSPRPDARGQTEVTARLAEHGGVLSSVHERRRWWGTRALVRRVCSVAGSSGGACSRLTRLTSYFAAHCQVRCPSAARLAARSTGACSSHKCTPTPLLTVNTNSHTVSRRANLHLAGVHIHGR